MTEFNTVYSFLDCVEFHNKYDGMDNASYVRTLFANLGATGTIDGKTVIDFVARINVGDEYARYDVARDIAASREAVQILGASGEKMVIDGGITLPGSDGLPA